MILVSGNGTFGQLSRFGARRWYVMHQKLSELENEGWKDRPEFDMFKRSILGVGGGENGMIFSRR